MLAFKQQFLDWFVNTIIPILFVFTAILLAFPNLVSNFRNNMHALEQKQELISMLEQNPATICQYIQTEDVSFRSVTESRKQGITIFCATLSGDSVDFFDLASGCEATAWLAKYTQHIDDSLLSVDLANRAFELCGTIPVAMWLSQEMLTAYQVSHAEDMLETYSLRLIDLPIGNIITYATFIQDNLRVGDPVLALKLSETAVSIYPEHARLRYLHGLSLAENDQTERAIVELCLASRLRQDEAAAAYRQTAYNLAGSEIDCDLLIDRNTLKK